MTSTEHCHNLLGLMKNMVVIWLVVLWYFSTAITSAKAEQNSPYASCYMNDHDTHADNDDVDVKFSAILQLQSNKNSMCSDNYFSDWQDAIAMKWVVLMLNGRLDPNTTSKSFIPNLTIGMDIINGCSIISKAALHAGQLMSEHSNDQCGLGIYSNTSSESVPPLVGVLGTSTSKTTTIVADILSHHHIPLVGVSATVQELSDKKLYPNFIRANPSDLQQAQLIVELAKELKWFYIMGIHSDSNYGRLGMQEVKRLAEKQRLCLAETIEISEEFLDSETKMEDLVRVTLFSKLDKLMNSDGILGVVFFGNEDYFQTFMEFVDSHRKSWPNPDKFSRIHWILPDAVTATKQLESLFVEFRNKAFLISPSTVFLPSFMDYLTDVLSHPPAWLTDQWQVSIAQALYADHSCNNFNFTPEDVVRCGLRDIKHSSYLSSTIDSVYILVSLLKKAHSDHCGMAEGLCPALRDSIKKGLLDDFDLQDIAPVSYEDIGLLHAPQEFVNDKRELVKEGLDLKVKGQSLYSITQFDSKAFTQIAMSDSSNTLAFLNGYENLDAPSECSKHSCPKCHPLEEVPYRFKYGSVVLVGVFSLHVPRATNNFECGSFRNTSLDFIAMEGFVNIVNTRRKETDIDYGYLIVDDCYGPLRASKLLLDVLSGDVQIQDELTGQVLEPKNVWVVIGALTSPSTLAMLSHLKDLHKPLISYGATVPSLSDPILHPYFSRTTPSDMLMAEALVKILKNMKVTHVGSLVLDNIYGLELNRLFNEKAREEDICVEEAFKMTDYTNEDDIERVLGEFRAKQVKIVICLVSSTIVTKVLQSEPAKKHNFHFVSTDTWGLNANLIAGELGKSARGSLVLAPTSTEKFDFGLKNHLEHLNAFDDNAPVWLHEFWEAYHECDMTGNFNRGYTDTCQPKNFSPEDFKTFLNDPKSLRASVATISATEAITKLIEDRPDLINKGIGADEASDLTQYIRDTVLYSTNGKSVRIYNREGNGDSGFDVYNVQVQVQDSTGLEDYEYVLVGTVQPNGQLQIDWSKVKFYEKYGQVIDSVKSSCLHKVGCSVCSEVDESEITFPPPIDTPEEPSRKEAASSDDSSQVVGLALGMTFLLILLILAFVVFVLIRMGRLQCLGVKTVSERYDTVTSPNLPPRPDNRVDTLNAPGSYYYTTSDKSVASGSGESKVSGGTNSTKYDRAIDSSSGGTAIPNLYFDRDRDSVNSYNNIHQRTTSPNIAIDRTVYSSDSEGASNHSNRLAFPDAAAAMSHEAAPRMAMTVDQKAYPPPPRPHTNKQKGPKLIPQYIQDGNKIILTSSSIDSSGESYISAGSPRNSEVFLPDLNQGQYTPQNIENQPVLLNVYNKNNIYNGAVSNMPMYHQSQVASGGVFTGVPQVIYNMPSNSNAIPNQGISNPAFVESPRDEFGGFTKQIPISPRLSQTNEGIQPQNFMMPNNPMSYQNIIHQDFSINQPSTTNVSFVMSNPPPSYKNPTPHNTMSRSQPENDYLDVMDPPLFGQQGGNMKTQEVNKIGQVRTTPRSNSNINNNNNAYPTDPHNAAPNGQSNNNNNTVPSTVTSDSNVAPKMMTQAYVNQQDRVVSNLQSKPQPRTPTQTATNFKTTQQDTDNKEDSIPDNDIPSPTSTDFTSTTTETSEEDNNKYDNTPPLSEQQTPSIASNSNPVSLGFQPHSKLSINPEHTRRYDGDSSMHASVDSNEGRVQTDDDTAAAAVNDDESVL